MRLASGAMFAGARCARGVLGALLLLVLVAPAGAQEPSPAAPLGYGFVQGGILALDLDALNASLGAAGLPMLDDRAPSWGGGGYGVVGRFHIGGVGHGGLDPAAMSGSNRVALKGGYGMARVRYQALSAGGLSVYPAVGIGAGGMSLEIHPLDGPTSFDAVLVDPGRSATLSTGVFALLNAGLGVDFSFEVAGTSDGGGWGLILGVEGGYLYAPGDTSWKLDGIADVVGGPALSSEGFYLWFALGAWGRPGSGG